MGPHNARDLISGRLRLLSLVRRACALQDCSDRVLAEPDMAADQPVAQTGLGQLEDLRRLAVRRTLSWLAAEPLTAGLSGCDAGLDALADRDNERPRSIVRRRFLPLTALGAPQPISDLDDYPVPQKVFEFFGKHLLRRDDPRALPMSHLQWRDKLPLVRNYPPGQALVSLGAPQSFSELRLLCG